MKEEMQKTGKGCHAETRTESRCTHGVQTCMGIIENNLVEVPIVERFTNAYYLAEQHEPCLQAGRW